MIGVLTPSGNKPETGFPFKTVSRKGAKIAKMSENEAPLCPACQRPLLTRFARRCSYCGAMLPAELLLSPEQKAEIERRELLEWRQRREEAEERAKEKKNAHSSSGTTIQIPPRLNRTRHSSSTSGGHGT